jgi:hypothetical protein
MAAAGGSALLALRTDAAGQCAIIFVWGAIYGSLLVAIERRTRKQRAVS